MNEHQGDEMTQKHDEKEQREIHGGLATLMGSRRRYKRY
jgi:hypothetical protein